ncbi:uncharacterized protein TNCV_4409951 [Trichonephila clavipes]|nr:uncharacterized protein TNCV_4409951 [Trichonephila clavipes]
MLSETWLDSDEHVSIPYFDCCAQFKQPGCRAAGVAIYRKQKNSYVLTPHMNITYRQTSGLGIQEAKTRHRVSLVSAHVTTLEEDLKQQPLCQDSPKDVLSDSGLEIELAIPFVPNRDPPDTPQQSELGEVSCIIIHQNEVVTNSSSIWADILIKDLIPISKTSYGSSMEHMQVSVATERDPCPIQDSTTSITVSFNSVGLMVSSVLFPPDQ